MKKKAETTFMVTSLVADRIPTLHDIPGSSVLVGNLIDEVSICEEVVEPGDCYYVYEVNVNVNKIFKVAHEDDGEVLVVEVPSDD